MVALFFFMFVPFTTYSHPRNLTGDILEDSAVAAVRGGPPQTWCRAGRSFGESPRPFQCFRSSTVWHRLSTIHMASSKTRLSQTHLPFYEEGWENTRTCARCALAQTKWGVHTLRWKGLFRESTELVHRAYGGSCALSLPGAENCESSEGIAQRQKAK